ncbi:MAG: acyl-CoA dehydrogenase family protein [Deltaproteobacteria bacterium]|nr:acyl-CoA dehydrogenase family protein [Deltaproteobacteria bacterium]
MQLKRLAPEELETVLSTLREFAERKMPLEKRLEWDRQDACPEALIREMLSPQVGLHLLFIPEEYDGMGGGAYDVYRLSTEFAQIDLGIATAMLAIALGTDPIRVGCTPQQKLKWMTRIANEGLIVAYGVTEPEAGSDVVSIKTKAERITNSEGVVTHYRINGVKQFISNGAIADLYTILAKTADGPSFFVVERGSQGLEPGKQEVKHGIRLSNTAQVVLEDVIVPADNLVGAKEGEGLKQANEVFGFTRLMVAAFGLGVGLAGLKRAIAFSKERKASGTFLCQKQGYTHKLLVPNSVRLAAAQAYIEYVAELLDSSEEDRQIEGSVAKLVATEFGNRAADDAIQALGGYGYCTEYEVEKISRDARILTIYEGTSEIQQNIIGLFRMRQSVKSKGEFYRAMADQLAGCEAVGGAAVARAAQFLSEASVLVFKQKLSREQHAMFEMAWAMAELETAVALCNKAAKSADPLVQAQSRVWAAEINLNVPLRMLKLFSAAGAIDQEKKDRLFEIADLNRAFAQQRGMLDEINWIAARITSE